MSLYGTEWRERGSYLRGGGGEGAKLCAVYVNHLILWGFLKGRLNLEKDSLFRGKSLFQEKSSIVFILI